MNKSGLLDEVCIVGAGLGGLASAVLLASRGHRVTVFDGYHQAGGKCNRYEWEGFRFDTGPSLLTLPSVLQSVFQSAGRDYRDFLDLVQLDPGCRYTFADGLCLDVPASVEGFRRIVAEHFPSDLVGYDRFMHRIGQQWQVAERLFLFYPFCLKNVMSAPLSLLLKAVRWNRWGSMRSIIESYFQSPHLRQLFMRYATYNGSDPSRAAETFNVIPYAELSAGAWHCRGGMYRIVESLVELASDMGVEFIWRCPVHRVLFDQTRDRVKGLALEDGRTIDCQWVVVNADAIQARTGPLLSEHPQSERWKNRYRNVEASVSGYVLLMALDNTVEKLACHNVYFCEDYDREFRQIFDDAKALDDPTLYVSVPSKVDESLAPGGKEAWFVLVNAPSLDRYSGWEPAYEKRIVSLLRQRIAGFTDELILRCESRSPRFLKDSFGAWHGSIYGASSNTMRQAFGRVPNRDSVHGLYFSGGSAHPGGGIPLVLTSGRLAAEALAADAR